MRVISAEDIADSLIGGADATFICIDEMADVNPEAWEKLLDLKHGLQIRYDQADGSNLEGWRAVRKAHKPGEVYSIVGRHGSRNKAIAAAIEHVGGIQTVVFAKDNK